MENKSALKTYLAFFITALILIFSLISFIIGIMLINKSAVTKYGILESMLEKQRMLTQTMTKDAEMIDEHYIHPRNAEDEKFEETKRSLKEAESQYDKTNNTIKNAYIENQGVKISLNGAKSSLAPLIEKNGALWTAFKKNINIVLSGSYGGELAGDRDAGGKYTGGEPAGGRGAGGKYTGGVPAGGRDAGGNSADRKYTGSEFADAVDFIDANSLPLLEYSDKIASGVQSDIAKRSTEYIYLLSCLEISVLILLSALLIHAYKKISAPLKLLYLNMSQVGITEDSNTTPRRKNKNTPFLSEINDSFKKLRDLMHLIESIGQNVPFNEILNDIYKEFSAYIPYTYIGVALLDDTGKNITASYAAYDKRHENIARQLLGYKCDINQTSLGSVIKNKEERVINDLEAYIKGKPLKEYNKILLSGGIRSSITLPLKHNDKAVGIIFFSSDTKNIYTEKHVNFLKTLANSLMLSLEEDILIDDMILSSTLALAYLTEERDPETGMHLDRMKAYAREIAIWMSRDIRYKDIIDNEYIKNIDRYSPLHDIGKVAIRDEILLKPSLLTPAEFEIMKTHTTYGAKVLRKADEYVKKTGRSVFSMAIEIAESHHEKWDGSGYPYGLSKEEIPLCARIVAVADVFDALTTKRPYKEAYGFEKSVGIIKDSAGTHFDPYIVSIFMENIDSIKALFESLR